MKPNSLVTQTQSGNSSPDDRGARSSKYSYSTEENAIEIFHGLPGPEFDQLLMRPTVNSSRLNGNNIVYSKFCQQAPQVVSAQLHSMAYQYPGLENPYELMLNTSDMLQHDRFMEEQNEYFEFAYTWPRSYGPETSVPPDVVPGLTPENLLNSLQQNCINEFVELDHLENAAIESPKVLDQINITNSPTAADRASCDIPMALGSTPGLIDTASSRASDDGNGTGNADRQEGNPSTTSSHVSDAPYAKLIYKALMEAPNHSMVLQDIYQWFINNTAKGKSASTGWRNSIRHNLSMNAAFRKTSRKSNGDDTKRTSEWVLEPFAILEGVTPTTRYRKNGKKGHRVAGSMPTRIRSDRLSRVPGRKSQIRSQRSWGEGKDMILSQQHHTESQHCASPIMDQRILSPHTPNCQQPFSSSLYQPSLPVLANLGQYVDVKPGNGVRDFMDEHEPYLNTNTYLWANSPYY